GTPGAGPIRRVLSVVCTQLLPPGGAKPSARPVIFFGFRRDGGPDTSPKRQRGMSELLVLLALRACIFKPAWGLVREPLHLQLGVFGPHRMGQDVQIVEDQEIA